MTKETQKKYALVALLIITNVISISFASLYFKNMYSGIMYDLPAPNHNTNETITIINETEYVIIPVQTGVKAMAIAAYVNESIWELAWSSQSSVNNLTTPTYHNDSYIIIMQFSSLYNMTTSYNMAVSFSPATYVNDSCYEFLGYKMLIYNYSIHDYRYHNYYDLPNGTIWTKNWFDVIFFARGELPTYENFAFTQVIQVTTTMGYDD